MKLKYIGSKYLQTYFSVSHIHYRFLMLAIFEDQYLAAASFEVWASQGKHIRQEWESGWGKEKRIFS